MNEPKLPKQFEYMKKVHDMVIESMNRTPKEEPKMICMECGGIAKNEKVFTLHGMCERCFVKAAGFDPTEHDIITILNEISNILDQFKLLADNLNSLLDQIISVKDIAVRIANEKRAIRKEKENA